MSPFRPLHRPFPLVPSAFFLAAIALFNPVQSAAQGVQELSEVVVTATRLPMPAREVAASATVITAEEIARSGAATVQEVLDRVLGLDVVENGGLGQASSLFVRGAKSEHVLVLIDGVEVNSPVSPGRSFDFAHLTVDDVERIEVVRGPLSTLYGSDAMGGVISVTTRRGKAGKAESGFQLEGGSENTTRGALHLRGGSGKVGFAVTADSLDTDGISAADARDGNREKDGYHNISVSTRADFQMGRDSGFSLLYRGAETSLDSDEFGAATFVFEDDPNSISETIETVLRGEYRAVSGGGRWEQAWSVSSLGTERTSRNRPDAVNPDSTDALYEAESLQVDWQNNIFVSEAQTLTVGAAAVRESARSRYDSTAWGSESFDGEKSRTVGAYLQDHLRLSDRFFATLGVRQDRHSEFGSEFTWRAAPVLAIPVAGLKVKATYGTGFKAPSLYQLHSRSGNEDLDPERSAGWDLGFEQTIRAGSLAWGATWYRTDYEDLIDWVLVDVMTFAGEYRNVAKVRTEGVELFARVRPSLPWRVDLSLALSDAQDEATDQALLRRPKSKADLDFAWQPTSKGSLSVGLTEVGERIDFDYALSQRVVLEPYLLARVSASYRLTERFTVTGRVENLLDEEYQEVLGYGTPGISAYLGVRAGF